MAGGAELGMNFLRTNFLLGALLLGASLHCAAAAPSGQDHVEANLIAENDALATGDVDNWIALRLVPDRGWHTYWINPGDSGIPTKLTWMLPDGVTAGEIRWPYPQRHSLGDLTNYGYGEETLHLVPVRVAASWPRNQPVELKAVARWLACADICIPGSAELSLSLPVSAQPKPEAGWREAFTRTRAALPVDADWSAQFAIDATDVSVQLASPELKDATVEMYPVANDLVNHGTPQRIARDAPDRLRLSQHLSAYFVRAPATLDAVFVLKRADGAHAYHVIAKPGAVAAAADLPTTTAATMKATPEPAPADTTPPALPLVLMFAVLGGLILNLMPCVFPVLSLKAIALMQSREDAQAHHRHALAYTAGVLASCVGTAAVLMGLRAGGAAIGWGFQLQTPAFVGLLAYLLFALGLSMSGVVEFGTSLMGVGESLTRGRGLGSSFFTGVLAVVVASPCTAPFMGTALGYALTQPAAVGLLVFAALGLGLALPFLVIGFVPRLAAWLPRPGAWMQTFREAMAFPLYLTVAWLLWVLARQTDPTGAALASTGLVLIAFSLWLWRREGWTARVLRLLALAGAVALLFDPALSARSAGTSARSDGWEPWSEARVAELRAQHQSIFVDFTADWCLTCKLNERTALSSERVRAAFRDQHVTLLQGDWTRADPAITAALAAFGRSGVPLYILYIRGGEPQVLPQVLTPNLLVDALGR
jgi:thiol:disulfide interchange protein DsbD